MLGALVRGVLRKDAAPLWQAGQQLRFLNVHEYQVKRWWRTAALHDLVARRNDHSLGQSSARAARCIPLTCLAVWRTWAPLATQGAQLMSMHGVNVPEGMPATTVAEAEAAASKMADAKGEVGGACVRD